MCSPPLHIIMARSQRSGAFLLLLSAHAYALQSTSMTRRTALVTSILGVGPTVARADDSITKMDAFQLRASYRGLSDALQAWNVEIAQVQLGNEPSAVVAVAGLSDVQLQRFAATSADSAKSVESFQKRRNEMLQSLFLARGAARYEKDTAIASDYIAKARSAAEQAQVELETIAGTTGVELSRSKRAMPAPEEGVKFTPSAAPRVENRLIF